MSHSQHAVHAASNADSWGRFAVMRYLEKRGVPFALYRLARQLRAVKGA